DEHGRRLRPHGTSHVDPDLVLSTEDVDPFHALIIDADRSHDRGQDDRASALHAASAASFWSCAQGGPTSRRSWSIQCRSAPWATPSAASPCSQIDRFGIATASSPRDSAPCSSAPW